MVSGLIFLSDNRENELNFPLSSLEKHTSVFSDLKWTIAIVSRVVHNHEISSKLYLHFFVFFFYIPLWFLEIIPVLIGVIFYSLFGKVVTE